MSCICGLGILNLPVPLFDWIFELFFVFHFIRHWPIWRLYMLSLGLGVMCVLMKQSLACYLVENEICDIRLQYMYIKLMFVAMVTVCKTRLVVWIYIFVPKTFR